MSELLDRAFGTEGTPTRVNNPFKIPNIDSIVMRMGKHFLTKELTFRATVYFKNGRTSGEQDIDGENFPDLFDKVIEFCKTLE